MKIFSFTNFKKAISEIQEDPVRFQLSKSRILCFCLDGPVMCTDAHQHGEASKQL